jgi:PAS domain S-box-containing protein
MTPQQALEMTAALNEVKGGVALLALLALTNMSLLLLLGVLATTLGVSVVKQLNACYAILTLSKGWTALAERRETGAAQSLQRIERIVVPAYSSAMVVADEAGVIVEWDAGAVTMFLWTRDEAVGRPVTLVTPPRFAGRHTAKFREAVAARRLPAEGLTIAGRAVTKPGREIGVVVHLSGWEAGGKLFYRAQIERTGDNGASGG